MTAKPGLHIPGEVNVHRPVGGPFAEGAAYTNATPITTDIVLSRSGMCRIWGKFSKGGTLVIQWLRAHADGVYATKAHTDVTVADATEFNAIVTSMGERGLRLTFTPGADGSVTYCDVAAIEGIQG